MKQQNLVSHISLFGFFGVKSNTKINLKQKDLEQLILSHNFWALCCQSGIVINSIPKPFKEEEQVLLVEKYATFVDKKLWSSARTFSSVDVLIEKIMNYFATGDEPIEEEKNP